MKRLREWRAAHLLSVRALAAAANITAKTLIDIEYGRRRPTYATMRSICQALGVAPADVTEFVAAMEARGRAPTETHCAPRCPCP